MSADRGLDAPAWRTSMDLPRRTLPHRGRLPAATLALIFLATGCDVGGDDSLAVASAWPAAGRARAEALFRETTAARVRWVVLAPGDDITRVANRRRPPDLILGGPASAYDALTRRGLLEPSAEGAPAWYVAPGSWATRPIASFAFNEPRRDPNALRRAKGVLESGPWSVGYARLIGEVERTPAREGGDLDFPEGVAAVRGSRHAAAARSVLDDLARRGRLNEPILETNPDTDALLADLLGATLVDARDELVSAWSALDAAGKPARSLGWMSLAPPWPPASVGKILARESNAMPLLETLAAQVAPEPGARAWLLRSWLSPPRLIDGRVIDELAGAAEGRLVREPRFRAWLRAEWTAWARQRYRRVARQAGALAGTGAPPS